MKEIFLEFIGYVVKNYSKCYAVSCIVIATFALGSIGMLPSLLMLALRVFIISEIVISVISIVLRKCKNKNKE